MAELNTKEIQERCERATEGPWTENKPDKVDGWQPGYCIVANMGGKVYANPSGGCSPSNDIRFIAHARQDIPALLELVATLQARLARYE